MTWLKLNWIKKIFGSGIFWLALFFIWIVVSEFSRGYRGSATSFIGIFLFTIGSIVLLKNVPKDDEIILLDEKDMRYQIEKLSSNISNGWILFLLAFFILIFATTLK